MSGKREKAVRRALRMYEGIVNDVEESKQRCRTAEAQSERALDIVMGQADYNAGERTAVEQRLRGELRKEREERRRVREVAEWALALAIVECVGFLWLAAVVLL